MGWFVFLVSLYIFTLLLSFLFSWCNSLSLCLLLIVSLVFIWTHSTCCGSGSRFLGVLLFLLYLVSFCFFTTSSLLVLYLRFEVSLLPLSYLVLLFGYQPEKLASVSYFLLYTVLGSLPFLYYLSLMGWSCCSVLGSMQGLSAVLVSLSFFIKSPLYYFHSWLPKAHTEAPLLGSMVLAGVILKFGGYGILLISTCFSSSFYIFFYLALSGGVICSLLCLRHWDMKTLIAYSSVVHMGVSTLGALSCTESGYWVSLSILISHSLVSPLLFSLCASLYRCSHSRAILNNVSVSLSSWLTLAAALLLGINMGTPPSLSFWVEVSLYVVMVQGLQFAILPLFFCSFLVFCYCMFLILVHLVLLRQAFFLSPPHCEFICLVLLFLF